MANGQYIGVNGVARKVTAPYIGVNAVARKVTAGYVGVNGVARLFFAPESGNVVLEVEKVTSDTYANSTTYTGEQFILLNIYPKTGGTVNVTYGGLTKTITDTSGAAEPNAQRVFFGTFNGVSDSVATPSSGELTIDGDFYAFGCSVFQNGSKELNTASCACITEVIKWGDVSKIPDYAFYDCSALTNGTIPDGVTSIGSGAFQSCTALTNVTIPDGVTRIGNYAFQSCTALTNLVVSSGNEYYSSVGGALFNKNKSELLSYSAASGHYIIPSSVTIIYQYAFYNATALTDVTIPASVTSIGNSAFDKCTALKSITILATTPPTLPTYVFSNCTALEEIIVPKGCGDTYKAAENWSTWRTYIVEAT